MSRFREMAKKLTKLILAGRDAGVLLAGFPRESAPEKVPEFSISKAKQGCDSQAERGCFRLERSF